MCTRFQHISDGLHRVQWFNGAYKRLLMEANDAPPPEIMVWLLLKQNEKLSRMLPCDVWKMDGGGGGFAWRLDVEAALSLGREGKRGFGGVNKGIEGGEIVE
ncbi:Cytochrome C1 family isoform 1 [Hibiscus syriacus]|uniref:Cytochrome C1 family isoform 1 n=1 Tax=Hibiscus syriacus TaxID=106335 RepID=A0A6A2YBX9_HIBSY|nr:Cytochrome C1 family isoform 1 [Hibiscus syriacus]